MLPSMAREPTQGSAPALDALLGAGCVTRDFTPCTETKAGLDNSVLALSSSRSLEMDIQSMLRFLVDHSGDQKSLN